MYDTKLTEEITLESILSKVTEYDIYRFYIGSNFDIGKIMSSPFRTDKNPSFGIFKSSKTSALLYKDLANGSTGNCIKFVQELFNITYKKALAKVKNDMANNNLTISTKGVTVKEEYKYTETILSVRKKNFCKIDDEYWGQFSLNRDDLRHFNVFPIHEYWINDIVQPWGYKYDNPGYAYQIYNKYKIYKPLESKKYKWVSNCGMCDLQGYEQLPYKGDLLIITKSLKDVMVLHKLGYSAIAPQGENHHIPEKVMVDLENRFTKIIVFYDNDEAGITGANKISKRYNLSTIFIPEGEPKDISDYTKKHGLDKSEELLIRLINSEEKK
jgi:hypothetical protein